MADMYVVQSEAGGFWCGYKSWDTQLRHAKIYVSKKYAEEVVNDYKELNPKIVPVYLSLTDPKYHDPGFVWCEDCTHFVNYGVDGEGECDIDGERTYYGADASRCEDFASCCESGV